MINSMRKGTAHGQIIVKFKLYDKLPQEILWDMTDIFKMQIII